MKNVALWLLAFIITISSAIYQRMTGPTYPLRGKVTLNSTEIKYKLARSHGGEDDHQVKIAAADTLITGYLTYKRYKTADEWTKIPMKRQENLLAAELPHQPPAGKLMYKVFLSNGDDEISLSGDDPIIIRFKGAVPAVILIPHIIVMFAAMLISNRTGLAAVDRKSNPRKFALWAIGLLFVGGMILGPLVQKYAFGAYWTGFPFGTDLTDNKTLVAIIGWILAIPISRLLDLILANIFGRSYKTERWFMLAAAIITLAVYLIPHSLMGSELDYSKMATCPK